MRIDEGHLNQRLSLRVIVYDEEADQRELGRATGCQSFVAGFRHSNRAIDWLSPAGHTSSTVTLGEALARIR
jgi:hypothetical protein